MHAEPTSTPSPQLSNENEPSTDSLETSEWQISPLEALWSQDLTTMGDAQLKEHLMRLREVATSPVRRSQMLKDEAVAITTKTTRKPKKLSLNDLY